MSRKHRKLRARGAAIVALLVALLGSATPGWASETERVASHPSGVVTLEQAVAATLARNPALAIAEEEIRAREAEVDQAGRRPNPEIDLGVESFGGSGELSGLRAAEATLLLSQTFELGGKRAHRREVAEREVDLATWEREMTRVELVTRTRKAFYQVQGAQERLVLAEELVGVAEQVLTAVASRVRAGASSPVEESRARVELETTRIDRDRAAADLEIARVRLAETWGGSGPDLPSASGVLGDVGELPDLASWEVRLDQAPIRRLALAAAAHRRALVAAAQTLGTPDLTFGSGLNYASDSDDLGLVVEFSAPLPIFDRGAGTRAAANARVGQAEAEGLAMESRLYADLRSAHESMNEAWIEVGRLREEALPQAEAAFAASQEAYLRGALRLTDVLDSERLLFELRHRRVEALLRCHQAYAELEGIVGAPAESWER